MNGRRPVAEGGVGLSLRSQRGRPVSGGPAAIQSPRLQRGRQERPVGGDRGVASTFVLAAGFGRNDPVRWCGGAVVRWCGGAVVRCCGAAVLRCCGAAVRGVGWAVRWSDGGRWAMGGRRCEVGHGRECDGRAGLISVLAVGFGGNGLVGGGRDRGAASIFVLAVGLVLVAAGVAGAAVGAARVGRHEARTAADLGALAGAAWAIAGPAVACERAGQFVSANGGRMTACHLEGLTILIEVGVTVTPLPGLTRLAMAAARAGPVSAPVE